MTGEQTAIPVTPSEPVSWPCAWCGKPAFDHIEIEPARWRNHNGVRVEAKAARTAGGLQDPLPDDPEDGKAMSCPCGCEDVKNPVTGLYELCPMAEGWYESLEEACPGERCKCDECMPDIIDPTPWLS